MRKHAYILHGVTDQAEVQNDVYPSMSNSHWLPWLQKQLVKAGYICQTPELPDVWAPDYNVWRDLFNGHPVPPTTTLVGHSAGGGFFLKWLSQNDVTVEKLVLVAPWLDPDRTRGEFLTCTLNPNLAERVREMHIFIADNEDVVGVPPTAALVSATYPNARVHRFATHGHFCFNDMKTDKFPELLQVIL